ncbi:hypothetical protein OH76DRAFT_1408298 [Lentinus brumalis]|uniref:Uncharacterized protein n=1 Tax=Lentinus brumalis TaxID=2498619 RepID=A0A371CY03_9APHY|nr:hypothetical protein OH76DRAFT_1408298 [Polyporus brumalis]
MWKDVFLLSILLIGLLFSASLILSDTAYSYISRSRTSRCSRRSRPSRFCSSRGHFLAVVKSLADKHLRRGCSVCRHLLNVIASESCAVNGRLPSRLFFRR